MWVATRSCLARATTLAVVLGLSSATVEAAPIAAVEYDLVNVVGWNSLTSVMVGWAFDLNSPVHVVSLGAMLGALPVGQQPPAQAEVGLWDPGGALLASATVLNTDPLMGHFRYHDITPLDLPAGSGYTVAGLWPQDGGFALDVSSQVTPAEVSYVAPRHILSAILQRPTVDTNPWQGSTGYFGPTFGFEAAQAVVPEPGTLALLGCGLVGMVRRPRRR